MNYYRIAILVITVLLLNWELRAAEKFSAISAEAQLFEAALAREAKRMPSGIKVTGVTVPHHLLAADLIARGVQAAAGNRYDRLIILSPDHFRRSRKPIATTSRGFETLFGPIEIDQGAVAILIANEQLVEESELFEREHGITAILPFLRRAFPGIPLVPVTLGIGTTPAEWDSAVELLKHIVTPATLIVQSTDYSHYLLPHVARSRDQEALNTIALGEPHAIATLHQPNHLDSKAAQYVQMRLQREVFGSRPVIVANRNAFEYVPVEAPSTSYIVSVFGPDAGALSRLSYDDQQIAHFGGDVFLGRWFTKSLTSDASRAAVIDRVLGLTGGQPLIVNLEGVLVRELVVGAPADRHVMNDGLAGPLLAALNVKAASLANNHSFDLGREGLRQTVAALAARKIRAVEHSSLAEFGGFRLLALNFVGVGDHKGYPVARWPGAETGAPSSTDVNRVCRQRAKPPLIAFVHWGQEFVRQSTERERALAERLAQCGVNLVIGGHSHQASPRLEAIGGGEALMAYSLGNLLFDQSNPQNDGALLELRVFRQGTFAARLIPTGNIYAAIARQ